MSMELDALLMAANYSGLTPRRMLNVITQALGVKVREQANALDLTIARQTRAIDLAPGYHKWERPQFLRAILISMTAGGGGGGAGASAMGGGGGSGGERVVSEFVPADQIPPVVRVFVGFGGPGGGTAEDGSDGSDSAFGALLRVRGGRGGKAGSVGGLGGLAAGDQTLGAGGNGSLTVGTAGAGGGVTASGGGGGGGASAGATVTDLGGGGGGGGLSQIGASGSPGRIVIVELFSSDAPSFSEPTQLSGDYDQMATPMQIRTDGTPVHVASFFLIGSKNCSLICDLQSDGLSGCDVVVESTSGYSSTHAIVSGVNSFALGILSAGAYYVSCASSSADTDAATAIVTVQVGYV